MSEIHSTSLFILLLHACTKSSSLVKDSPGLWVGLYNRTVTILEQLDMLNLLQLSETAGYYMSCPSFFRDESCLIEATVSNSIATLHMVVGTMTGQSQGVQWLPHHYNTVFQVDMLLTSRRYCRMSCGIFLRILFTSIPTNVNIVSNVETILRLKN